MRAFLAVGYATTGVLLAFDWWFDIRASVFTVLLAVGACVRAAYVEVKQPT